MTRVSQARQDTSHVSKAADNAGHKIVRMNFILQIDEAFIFYRAKSFKNLLHRHDAVSHRDLTILILEIREVLHVYVKQPRARLTDSLNYIGAANRMSDVDATPHSSRGISP
jgi:hypothetical protein